MLIGNRGNDFVFGENGNDLIVVNEGDGQQEKACLFDLLAIIDWYQKCVEARLLTGSVAKAVRIHHVPTDICCS